MNEDISHTLLEDVIHQVVLSQYVLSEIVFHVAPDRVDMVGAVLDIVELNDEVAAMDTVVMIPAAVHSTGPNQIKIV